MADLKIRLQKALKEIERLKGENKQLKDLLTSHHIPIQLEEKSLNEAKNEKIKARIQLFRSLFKGRDDVFAQQWRKDNGKIQYSPAYNRKSQEYIPLTDQVIYNHLAGKKVIGIYPVQNDDTCWFVAIDFDKKNWKKDARAFMSVCKEYEVPANMERSRSGNGCHIWIFFNDAIPAKLARKLGHALLSRTREKQGNLESFDRLFPNQDSLPKGGFGNLIALPLQKKTRKQNNSVFLDESFNPYSNQWKYLSQISKITREAVEGIINKYGYNTNKGSIIAEKIQQVILPAKIEIIYKNGLYIPKDVLPEYLLEQITKLGRFNNPKYYQAQAKRLSTYNIPKIIDCTDNLEDELFLPRGCFGAVKKLLQENQIQLIVKNNTNLGRPVNSDFLGKLTAQQEEAVQTLLHYKTGILSAATGFGKTVVAAALIARRNVNTLVIVHTKQLLDQWKERLSSFLQLDHADIGQIGGGKRSAKGSIDIATIQSLGYQGKVKDIIKNYGQIIVDECHHISAFSFERVLKHAEATYVHGLTATPTRKDGLHPIMTMQCGPTRYKVSAKDQAKVRPFKHVLLPRKTFFKSKLEDNDVNIQRLYSEISQDTKRNEKIFNDVLLELERGSKPIILTERIEHVYELEKMFRAFAKNIIVLTGELKKKERETRLQQLKNIPDEKERLIIATGKYIGEGFDNAVLDTLFLVMPIAWKGTLQQYVGRLHRVHENKEMVKVYDYVDYREDIFKNMFEKRKSGYKALGYIVEEAGSKALTEQMRLF
ncbi:TOTE conflict system archaeo-eukaryotic primase domain-containing protein [Oceanobacillus halophilus]|uniref:DEAD/DEAH box helicase n=1 Tax=Oceanobacillus halophilus TaxID=930130 RepID=A0A495AAU7_9BACI|nr:DEAD/DEAH box helicase [Oceanobacillus halophilus]RKQ35606.1 DEAD/DEAH box helicase [Oceanobacillus halophilus]